jgi:dipicolinate synthase subunit A
MNLTRCNGRYCNPVSANSILKGGSRMEVDYQFQIAVIGGDVRQLAVVEALLPMAQTIKVYGHSQLNSPNNSVVSCPTVEQTLDGVNIVILPISGMNDSGMVRGNQTDQFIDFGRYFHMIAKNTLLLTGTMTAKWLELANRRGLKVIQYAEDNAIAILNSVPTAEGAVQIALEQLPVTIHGSSVLTVGFGRVGMTVARTFLALGAKVTVVARRFELLARAQEMGCATMPQPQLAKAVEKMRLIINTVPALLIDRTILARTAPEVLIIDLASAPGGIDYDAAEELGRKAIFAPGLPGKVAPQTAGAILASAIPELIIKSIAMT